MRNFAEEILERMQHIIKGEQLEIMKNYPRDVLVHARHVLEAFAYPGAQLAWMVNHLQCHVIPIGIHPSENALVTRLTQESAADRFYFVTVSAKGVNFHEQSRESFAALARIPIHYQMDGRADAFWVLGRGVRRLGYVKLTSTGTLADPKVCGRLAPCGGIEGLDRGALELWCRKAIAIVAANVFVKAEIAIAEPKPLLEAA